MTHAEQAVDVVSAKQERTVATVYVKNTEAIPATRVIGFAARETAVCQLHVIGVEYLESGHRALTGGGDRLACLLLVRSEGIWA